MEQDTGTNQKTVGKTKLICHYCNDRINEWRSLKSKRTFCSRKCYLKLHKEKLINIQCEVCGKIRICPKRRPVRFCSLECRAKVTGYKKGHRFELETIRKISETKKAQSPYKDKTTICKNCKKEFAFRTSKHREKRIFCSKNCLYEMGSTFGEKRSTEIIKKLSLSKIGKKNPMWKGGLSRQRLKVYQKAKYKKWREAVFERDHYTCRFCKTRGGKLEADHIKPWAEHKEGWFDINNGQTLCRKCHLIKTKSENRRGIGKIKETQFKKGVKPWSYGKKITREKHKGDFKKGHIPWNKGVPQKIWIKGKKDT